MYRLIDSFADGGDFMWIILFVAMLAPVSYTHLTLPTIYSV